MLLSNDLIQHVNAFTRVTNLTNTIIDHVVSNINDIKTIVSHFQISDHQIIFTLWGERAKNRPGKSDEMNKIIKKLHYKNTVTNLRNFNWNYWSEKTKDLDVNATFNSFQEAIQSSMQYESKKARKMTPIQPWMTQKILQQRLQLEKLRKKFLKKKTETNEASYKTSKKSYKSALKTAKNEFYTSQLQKAAKDGKKTWQIINQVLKRHKKSEKHDKIIHNDKEITDNQEIANTFSTFYKTAAVNKISELNSEMKFERFLNDEDKRNNTFRLRPVSLAETLGILEVS